MADVTKRNAADSDVQLQFKEVLARKQRQQRTGEAHGDRGLRSKGVSGPVPQKKIFRRKTG
ncbi:hypothetical protein GCM10009837_87530 [Streptomyces durmitorensis]|uniref:DUF5302 domain-containing protein n=1 Tax=Streptomyces durmitorensis TaxID=319947 RepID=A0ABY4Q9C9_9ACTN|nr:DUF5302 domain-containing protein [Streptomyces durmitorensis]UQT61954.1 DUF5302 domain-containing protein [Streptomyces durmitorensis]